MTAADFGGERTPLGPPGSVFVVVRTRHSALRRVGADVLALWRIAALRRRARRQRSLSGRR